MRNPENIDLVIFPPPPGYVVASEEDCDGINVVPADWLTFRSSSQEWTKVRQGRIMARFRTYLRPATPDGDQHDTDHQFPG